MTSIVESQMRKKKLIFFGPAAYINHDCEANTEWEPTSKTMFYAKTIKQIKQGEEITAYYGDHFFGEGNRNCTCHTYEILKQGHFYKSSKLSVHFCYKLIIIMFFYF